jgi:hypothetical protein
MTEFVDWKPQHDGHKPPFWVGTMGAETTWGERRRYHTPIPHWTDGVIYHVPREAVYGPHEDAGSPAIDPVLYERMAEVIKLLAMEVPYFSMDEIKAIAAELEPVDPLLQLAREVCAERFPDSIRNYSNGNNDGSIAIKAALAMGKAMKERGL